jgi:murein DD-endopeptidase MepM/ murein hydrolase activator NlpD
MLRSLSRMVGRCRWFVAVVFSTLSAVLVIGPAVPSSAQTNGDRQQQLQDQINQLGQQQRDALGQVATIQAQKATIDAQVAELDKGLRAAEAKLAPLAAEADRIDGIVADLQAQIDDTQRQLDAQKVQLNSSVAEMYRSARASSATPLGFSGSPDQYLRSQMYLREVSRRRNDLVQRVSGLRDDLAAQKQALHDEQQKADKARQDATVLRDQAAALKNQLLPAQSQAAQQAAAEQAKLTSIQSAYGDDLAELAALQGAQDGIAQVLRAHTRGGASGHCTARPVPFAINSPYGPRDGGFHPGIDMAGPSGTPIVACRSGQVVIAGWLGGYGNAVVISHDGNMGTLYGHQTAVAVTVGQSVQAGQIIGYLGSTGFSTGPHLHFEVRFGGNTVDPAPYLP